ncbi:dihydroxyacetone kinase family protein [Tautonia rosea]|uniref:dihydroxyacetone kinase family protein n=1 Tax=Tautonia rosea TaxID=2728037 RepID=UPI0014728124|nr:dihydroxyacetone kinase family protein [Tautonia rosea]
MKKLINNPHNVVSEMLEGLVLLDPELTRLEGHNVLLTADLADANQPRHTVALISGGGSGHEPAHAGYVGRGMLSAAVLGDVFTSPSTDEVIAAIRAVAGPAGVLLIVKNYTGDRLNFGFAAELARSEGIPVEMVIVADDVALSSSTNHAGRRGLAGTVLVHKVAGAASEAGASLAEVAAEARNAAESVRTMGVALSPGIIPVSGKPGFDLGPQEIEIGLGIHGEPGIRRESLKPVDELVDCLLDQILGDLKLPTGASVALLVNNLGATPPMELILVARRALSELKAKEFIVERVYVGTFLTSLEMVGVSLSVMRLDRLRQKRLDAPTRAHAWPNASDRSRSAPSSIAESSGRLAEILPSEASSLTKQERGLGHALHRIVDALLDAEPLLTDSDRVSGDGDLGISLARGARAIRELLPSLPTDDPAATLRALAATIQKSVGGTTGPLYAAGLYRASTCFRSTTGTDAQTWAFALRSAIDAIAEIGGAQAGDRTMLDALIPASKSLDQTLNAGATPIQALRAAVSSADLGVQSTTQMMPRQGRSSYLGSRVLGHPDPGAQAVSIWLHALSNTQ